MPSGEYSLLVALAGTGVYLHNWASDESNEPALKPEKVLGGSETMWDFESKNPS